jgi:hypothetical protein
MRYLQVVSVLVAAAGCGRTGIDKGKGVADAGPADALASLPRSDSAPAADMTQPGDLPWFTDSPIPSDAARLVEVAPPADSTVDAPEITDVARTDLSPSACSALQPLAARGVITSRRTKKVLFTHERSAVVLLAKNEADGGVGDDVLLVRLPSGDVASLAGGIAVTEWLGGESALLAKTSTNDLVMLPLDGSATRVIASQVCDHATSVDGRKVYASRGCSGGIGSLDVIDTSSWAATRVSTTALYLGTGISSMVASPGGRWAAFRSSEGTRDGSTAGTSLIRVVDSDGSTYALSSSPGASDPMFASEAVLVFSVGSAEIRGHIPGSGDQSYMLPSGGQRRVPRAGNQPGFAARIARRRRWRQVVVRSRP